MRFNWREIGIGDMSGTGNKKLHCPQCHDSRRNKRDKSLSVNGANGVYMCHHCGWAGRATEEGGFKATFQTMKAKTYRKPQFESQANAEDRTIQWFADRGISEAVVRRNRIEARHVWFSEEEPKVKCLAFPYIRDGEVVNVQYRTADKRFKLEPNCELVFYGLDDIQPGEPLFIVEGQMDKLALEEAGYPNCISVPNGSKVTGECEWLQSAWDKLQSAQYFVLAGDSDKPGQECMAELSRRLGVEKCWRVEWPEDCKDANDVLKLHSRGDLISCLECAIPLPINGLVDMMDLIPELDALRREGCVGGVETGWQALDELYRPRRGECTIITGSPGTGKSTFLDALIINLVKMHQWKFAIFSPEQEPLERHAATLLRVLHGKPFHDGQSVRMEWAQVEEGALELNPFCKFLSPPEAQLNIDGIIELAQAAITRFGIEGLVIDPWNELEHTRPPHLSETEFIGDSLRRLRRFARLNNIHLWIMVHPKKLEKKSDGEYPVPTPYDLNGSAHWFNKADMILSLWREKANQGSPVQIHSQKVRFAENGKLGNCALWWDRLSYRFSENRTDFSQAWELYE